jgi:hypothetical protein
MPNGKPLLADEITIQYRCPAVEAYVTVRSQGAVGKEVWDEIKARPGKQPNTVYREAADAIKVLGCFSLSATIEGGCETCESPVPRLEIECPLCQTTHSVIQ